MWQPNIRRVSYPLKQWKIKIHLQYQTEEDSNFTFNPNIFQIHRLTIFWIKLIISSETIVFLKRHTNLREAIKGSFNFFYYVQSRVFVKCAIAVFFHVFFFANIVAQNSYSTVSTVTTALYFHTIINLQ